MISRGIEMKFEDVLNNRHSTRKFNDEKIDEDVLKKIILDAQKAPSWANSQPWKVIIATGNTLNEIKENHLKLSRQGIPGNSDMETAHRTEWADNARENIGGWNTNFFNHLNKNGLPQTDYADVQSHLFYASALIYLVVSEPINDWEIFDLGAFSQTLMLSAANNDIQSIPAYELVRYPDETRKLLNLESSEKLLMGIALGHEETSKINDFRAGRVDTDSILTILD